AVPPDDHSYTYNPLNQIKGVDGAPNAYGFDAADNLSAVPGAALGPYSASGRLGALSRGSGTTAFAYDVRGNRTSTIPAAGPATSYAYDQANRLTSVDPTSYPDDLAAGWYHSVAARSDGTVQAWGNNAYGQLGDGTTTDRPTPTQVPGLSAVVAVAAGIYDSAALRADGTVWAWGWNNLGQVGDGTTVDRHSPTQVQGLSDVVAIAAGTAHFLALRRDGTVWSWGSNSVGQLGTGNLNQPLTPVQAVGLADVVGIAAGYTHSAALRADGTVWTWGYNGFGQLGDGTTTNRLSPGQVPGLAGVAQVASGYHHLVALKADGTVVAWGYNAHGQLGDGTTADRLSPVSVAGLANVSALVVGGYHSLAVRADATVAAWGYNAYGQLGNGSTATVLSPQTVPALAGGKGTATGPFHSLDLRADASARAWGFGGFGALGNGSPANQASPVAVPGYSRGTTRLATYAYRGDGLRLSKTVAGQSKAFAWDESGGVPLVLSDGDWRFVYGPGGRPISQVDAAGNVTYLHQDQLGSTRQLSAANGNFLATYTYAPYGGLAGENTFGGIATTPLRHAGEYTDAETGFTYLRARYYDPATGQFISRDPIESVTREPYGYVGGDPLNSVDPTGLFCLTGKNPNGSCRSIARGATNFAKDHVGEIILTVAIVGGVVCVVATSGTCAPVAGLVIARASSVLIAGGVIGLFVYDAHELARTPWKDKGGPRPCPDDFYDRLGETSLGLTGAVPGPLPEPTPGMNELPPQPITPVPPIRVR
ncbi:MAG: RHS repeat-associated core domain-containing protein, partial [Acidimicrobiales bacterium]